MDSLPSKGQYFAAFAASLGGLSVGSALAFSSPSGPILTGGGDPTIHLTNKEYGHFSSTLNFGVIAGAFFSGFLMSYLGRRKTMLISVLPYLIGWALIVWAKNFGMLIGGRLFTGAGFGITNAVVPIYIGETSSPRIRGKLCASYQTMVCIGMLYSYMLAPLTDSFRWMGGACMILPILFGVCVFATKDSPVYLLSEGKVDEAKDVLKHLRAAKQDISKEFQELQEFISERTRTDKSVRDLLLPEIRRPLLMMFAIVFFFNMSGINPVAFNLNQIFENVSSSISETLSPIIVGIIQIILVILSSLYVDKWGRRVLLIFSGITMSLSLVLLGVYFYLKEHTPETAESISWLPLVSTCIYFATFAFGFGPLPWIILGEIFTPEIREVASSVTNMFCFLVSYVSTAMYIPLMGVIDIYGVFWVHAGFCLLSALYCFFVLVETKGKTQQQIAQIFSK